MTIDEKIAQINNPQEFTRLCNAVLAEKYGSGYQVIDGSRADGGNDGYIIQEKRIMAMYCPVKPERTTDADYLAKIKSDIAKAQFLRDSGQYQVDNWTFMTPRKLSNDLIVKMTQHASSIGLNAIHQEATFLANELLKNIHIVQAFPYLRLDDIQSKLDEILTHIKSNPEEIKHAANEVGADGIYRERTDTSGDIDSIAEIRRSPKTVSAKSKLRAIYYKATDLVAKINAIFGIIDFYDPLEDMAEDIVQLCDEGIAIAERIGSPSAKALFLAQKGYFLSNIYSNMDMETSFNIKIDNKIGIQTVTEVDRQRVVADLMGLEKKYNSCFEQALSISHDNKDYTSLAGALIYIGNAAGQRALYLQSLGVTDRASSERATCRRALLTAKDLYDQLGDELESANAIFNLSNQIRFFGETVEAMELTKHAISIAKKYGDTRMLHKANLLMQTLETGKIPDYLAGERRE